jgi:serine protease Do
MSIYDLPKFKTPNFSFFKNRVFGLVILTIFISVVFGFSAGAFSSAYFYSEIKSYFSNLNIELPEPQIIEKEKIVEKIVEYEPRISQEQAIISAVENVSRAVVSIIITKDLSAIEVGGGTGFIISEQGMILTNKHVVLDKKADYTVLTNDGRKFPAKVLARDPFQDLAILKIEKEEKIDNQGGLFSESFPVVQLGDSSKLQIGQTVIAIGNALGEFRNTISVGVISGLGRTITASGLYIKETLEDVIQTDAAINKGNSGGPLLNSKGEVIGINTAMVQGAQSIGFAISINKAKKDIKQVQETGKISYPFLGIYYTLITENLKKEYDLQVNYGAWVGRDEYGEKTEEPIFPDSAAQRAGIQADDIILEFDKEKITLENSLAKLILKYNPGDKAQLKILRGDTEEIVVIILGKRSEED